jgi:hypothetical protein
MRKGRKGRKERGRKREEEINSGREWNYILEQ